MCFTVKSAGTPPPFSSDLFRLRLVYTVRRQVLSKLPRGCVLEWCFRIQNAVTTLAQSSPPPFRGPLPWQQLPLRQDRVAEPPRGRLSIIYLETAKQNLEIRSAPFFSFPVVKSGLLIHLQSAQGSGESGIAGP